MFRLRRKDQRFISLVSTVQRGEESINELKGQLKKRAERQFDGKVQEFRDRVSPTVSSDENVTMEDRCIHKQIVDFSTPRNGEPGDEVLKVIPQERLFPSGSTSRLFMCQCLRLWRRSSEWRSSFFKNECSNALLNKVSTCLFDKSSRKSSMS